MLILFCTSVRSPMDISPTNWFGKVFWFCSVHQITFRPKHPKALVFGSLRWWNVHVISEIFLNVWRFMFFPTFSTGKDRRATAIFVRLFLEVEITYSVINNIADNFFTINGFNEEKRRQASQADFVPASNLLKNGKQRNLISLK